MIPARPRLGLGLGALTIPAAGAVLTLGASYVAAHAGLKIGVLAVVVAFVLLGSMLAFLRVPHVALAATIPLFAFLPTLKVFVSSSIGGIKDVVDLAAILAMVVIVAIERRHIDRVIATCVLLLLGIYLVNPGHGHNSAWAQGVRLTGEPLLLLLVGLTLPHPRRNLRWSLWSLILTACAVATDGLLQQLVGAHTLVHLGYSYEAQVRTIGSFLRSFGTLDDPFAYAAFLLFGLAAIFFWLRRGVIAWAMAGVIVLGLGASFVRTGVLVILAYGALQLVRWRHGVTAAMFVTAAIIAAGLTLVGSSATQEQSATILVRGGSERVRTTTGIPQHVFLNGRVSAWTAALGTNPADWIFGRGVGKVGTAAARASVGLVAANANTNGGATAVDSGYFATMADVGLVGLSVELVLFGRLFTLARRHARRGSDTGWFALALLTCILLDAVTRASFTGFPTAFLGLLLLGIALAAADESTHRGPARPGP